jgi:hypothetical protein
MTREPKIPMAPDQLPQQRIHEVAVLPERPVQFDSAVGYPIDIGGLYAQCTRDYRSNIHEQMVRKKNSGWPYHRLFSNLEPLPDY